MHIPKNDDYVTYENKMFHNFGKLRTHDTLLTFTPNSIAPFSASDSCVGSAGKSLK